MLRKSKRENPRWNAQQKAAANAKEERGRASDSLTIMVDILLEWGWNAHANAKNGSRSQRGPVIGLDGRRIVASSRRGPGREEWRDLSLKKVQFASDFLHFKAHFRV